MSMSILLALIPTLLVLCIIVCFVLSSRRPEFINSTATLTVTAVLILWLVIGLNLPITLGEPAESNAFQFSVWVLRVDEIAWQLGLSLLILIESLFLAGLPRLQVVESTHTLPTKQRFLFPVILLMVTISLLGLWLISGPGLLTAWTIMGAVWLLLLWLASDGRVGFKELLMRAGFLLSGVIFLWLALATIDDPANPALGESSWPTPSMFWAMLAILVQFGAVPLQWWRPLDWSMHPSLAAIIHLIPSIFGASLFARLMAAQEPNLTILFLTTIVGLLGLLIGIALVWTHLDESIRVATGLVLAQAGLIILIGSWIGSAAVIAQSKLFVLALGSLFIAGDLPRQPYNWNGMVPLAALAGLPLTAGFVSLASLYNTWLTGASFLLAIVTMLLLVPFIGAALLAFRTKSQNVDYPNTTRQAKLRTSIGLLLPTVGLLALPTGTGTLFSPVSLIFILLAATGGIILGIAVRRDPEIQSGLQNAFHLKIPSKTYLSIFKTISERLADSIRGMAVIFEGEGGLLWLLLFIVVFWLALSS